MPARNQVLTVKFLLHIIPDILAYTSENRVGRERKVSIKELFFLQLFPEKFGKFHNNPQKFNFPKLIIKIQVLTAEFGQNQYESSGISGGILKKFGRSCLRIKQKCQEWLPPIFF